MAIPLHHGAGAYVVRVAVLGQFFFLLFLHRVVGGLHRLVQRGRAAQPALVQVGCKARPHGGAVGVGDVAVAADVTHTPDAPACVQGERWPEQEKGHALFYVKSHNLGKQGKGRIIHNRAPLRVFRGPVVRPRPEGPHKARPVPAVLLRHPGRHRFIHRLRRVTVVGGQLGFELVHKLVVFVLVALADDLCHPGHHGLFFFHGSHFTAFRFSG